MSDVVQAARATVLVSNTERHFAMALAQLLREQGWDVHAVESAQEALDRCETLRPRAVVTGLDDGEEDGFAFVAELTARTAAAGVPRPGVVMCTHQAGLAELGADTRTLLGIDVVVERPCRLEAVDDALGALLEGAGGAGERPADAAEEGAGAAVARACAGAEVAP